MIITNSKSIRHESKILRHSARGQECLVRIPGHCNFDPSTTILAHLGGGGMGVKKSDLFGSFCCSACHDVLDGRVRSKLSKDELELMHRQGVERTQSYWLDNFMVTFA